MGNDIADFNNDSPFAQTSFTLDMLLKIIGARKLTYGLDNYELFDFNVKMGFHHQYMRNMLQLNEGLGRGTKDLAFSEIGQLSGVSNTDWSWASLFADYDNDGWKDLFITNGNLRDFTNMDFVKFMGDHLKRIEGEGKAGRCTGTGLPDAVFQYEELPFSETKRIRLLRMWRIAGD